MKVQRLYCCKIMYIRIDSDRMGRAAVKSLLMPLIYQENAEDMINFQESQSIDCMPVQLSAYQ